MILFKKKSHSPLEEYFPDLAMYSFKDEADDSPLIHIRFSSEDENNINKNIRVKAGSIKSISLEINNLDGFSPYKESDSFRFIEFRPAIKIERLDNSVEMIELGDNKVKIMQSSSKFKSKSDGWADIDELIKEIKEIWHDLFNDAIMSYSGIESDSKLNQAPQTSIIGKIINYALIAAITFMVIGVSVNLIKSNQPTQIQAQNTAYEALSPEALIKQANETSIEQSSDDLILEEFGLEPGLDLDK